MEITFDVYQTLALAAIFYYIGVFLRNKITLLTKYCVPAPAVGGILFLIISSVLHAAHIVTIGFDTSLQTPLLAVFFVSVGLSSKLKMLLGAGKRFVLVLIACIVLVVLQNFVGIGIMSAFGQNKLLGLCVGSLPMVGGHATSAAFADVLEAAGCPGPLTVGLAAATFGVLAGGTLGGPTAKILITRHHLAKELDLGGAAEMTAENEISATPIDAARFMKAAGLLTCCLLPGDLLMKGLSKIHFTLPITVSSLIFGVIICNVFDAKHMDIPETEAKTIGGVCLNLFLTVAMMSIQIWQLSGLAIPFILALVAEAVLTVLFAYFIIFWVGGRNYEGAVMAAGVIGFGLGASPNALANMNTLKAKYGPAPEAFIVIPILGAFAIDIFLALITTGFINFLS